MAMSLKGLVQKRKAIAQKERTRTTSQASTTQPALLTTDPLLQLWEPFLLTTEQDLGGDHAEKDFEVSQGGSGQDALASRCPFDQELPGRHRWHGKGTQFVLR